MNDYQYFMERHDFCEQMALAMKDSRLVVFYKNAAIGFRTKAEKVKISEVRN